MARTGLDKLEVKKASQLLVSQGRYPSVDAVRIALGNTGSKTTIHKYLKELESEAGKVDERQLKTARTLQDFVEDLAAKLHTDADHRLEQMRAEYEATLARNNEEMAQLRAQITTLSAQLSQAELLNQNTEWANGLPLEATQRKFDKLVGFGLFDKLLNNARTGKQGWSKFSLGFNSRSSTPIDDRPTPGGDDAFAHI